MRLHQRRRLDFRRSERLGKEDSLLNWTKPVRRPETLSAKEFSALPDSLTLRQIRLQLNIEGFRVRSIIYQHGKADFCEGLLLLFARADQGC
jgi:hypothetical protein